MKRPKLKKSNEDDVKDKLKENYPIMREFYKRLSGFGMFGTVFSISLNTYTENIKDHLKLVEQGKFNLADCDRLFLTVNANKKGPLIPAAALVRF